MAATGVKNCGGCEAAIAQMPRSEQAMMGVMNRISRAEYTILIRVTDALAGSVIRKTMQLCDISALPGLMESSRRRGIAPAQYAGANPDRKSLQLLRDLLQH